nr:zinc-regulated protein 8-like [Ipomoea batatas]
MQQKKQYLHELLREEQEPFQLNTYIADRRCENRRLPPPPKTSVQLKKCSATKRSLSPNGRVRLNVPARTAALLLDAALRIQKQQQQGEKRARPQIGLGLFGSILKRLKDRNRNKKREIKNDQRKDDENVVNEGVEVKNGNGGDERLGVSYSRLSSAGWSESNEEKSLDLETSSSCRGDKKISHQNVYGINHYSDKENYENGGMENGEQEEEDEKEQCSPVSVLDPPFEDDNYGVEEEDDEGHDDSDLECSYAIVQRAQQQLLYKLRRFEKLAELDPIELEKIMLEEEEEDYEDNAAECDVAECVDHESFSSSRGDDDEDIERFASNGIIPLEIKRLVSDLISEEKTETNREVVWGRVCKRLDSWKEAKSETIDMMVELDLRTATCEWKSLREQVEETAMEIEVGIFGSLVDEFSGELMNKILT